MDNFFSWYEKHKTVHIGITSGLFLLQIIHLVWLALHIVALKLTGVSYFPTNDFTTLLLALVDYTEIPALISATLLYVSELKNGFSKRSLLFLLLVNTQWFHLFWITDEIVLDQLTGAPAVILPLWLSLLAIAVDYLEVPVIVDTTKRFVNSFKNGKA